MKLTFVKAVGIPVISEQAEGPVALMKETLINPEDGGVLAVSLIGSKQVISVRDIRKWSPEGVKVVDETSLIDREELIKLSEFSQVHTQIFAKEVYKEDGTLLGLVHDFVFDTNVGQLTQIYVVKKLLFFFTVEKRIIDYREIIEIQEERIIVKDKLLEKAKKIQDFLAMRKKIHMRGRMASKNI